jgi:hypothetical protein
VKSVGPELASKPASQTDWEQIVSASTSSINAATKARRGKLQTA